MRILYYIYSLPVGGAETIVAEYLRQLRQRGAQVLLVQDYRTESFLTHSLEEQGIPMVTLWPGSGESKLGQTAKKAARGVGLYRRFNKVIREFQPDVIHFHAFPDHMDRLDFPRSRMFYSFHAALERNLSMLGQKNTALLQSLSDDGLTFCGLTSDYAKEIGARFHTDRVLCIPNGLDFDRIRSQRYSREELRSLFGIPEDAFLLGTVGRLHPVKNQERMLSILREVQKSRPDTRLLIVGADQAGRAGLLRRQAAELGVADALVLAGERRDADAILAAMDCFLMTSHSEALPLVAIEAQVQGVKCVFSDAVPEDVACQDCVRLSLDESDEQWAEAVLNASACSGSPKTLDGYNVQTIITKLLDVYSGSCGFSRRIP